jgi:polysaccharide export outer membrane protein
MKNRNYRICLVIAAGLLIFAGLWLGCSGPQTKPESEGAAKFEAETEKNPEIERLNEKLLASADLHSDPSDYLLGPGDLLQITVFEAEELGTKARVSSRGSVSLPLLGLVQVEDLTAREAEIKIEEKYREKYIKDPHVTVFVEEHFSQRVTLVGEFKNPGTYDYPSKMRLLDVLALGGGLSSNAGRIVQVRRMGDSAKEYSMMMVDLDKLIDEGRVELNFEINGGDVIFVPKAGVYFVDGAVRKPGSYPITQKINVMEALVSAGGFQPYANESSATLVRYTEDGKRDVKELNLSKKEDQEINVQDRDVIIAKSNAFKKAVQGIRLSIGPGGLTVGYDNPEK